MRIRSIVPKFWESNDIERLPWDTRLVFIGLWSYADDNGVGRDDARLIAADLFPLADDPRDSRARVSRGLQELCDGGQVVRYTVNSEPFFFIVAWDSYQRVDRPAKARYKRPTCEDAESTIEIATPSRGFRESVATGEGEKGRRGEGEKGLLPSSAEPMDREHKYPPPFERFWKLYPRKVGKDKALPAWKAALRRTDQAVVMAGVERMVKDPNLPEEQFIPHPTTWLNRGGWNDAPFPPRMNGHTPKPSTTDERVSHGLAMAQRYAAQEALDEQRLEIPQ